MRPINHNRKLFLLTSLIFTLAFVLSCEKKQTNKGNLLTSLFYSPPPTNSLDPITDPIREGGEIQANIVVEKIKSGEYQINPGGPQEGKLGIQGSYTNLPSADFIYRDGAPNIGKVIPNQIKIQIKKIIVTSEDGLELETNFNSTLVDIISFGMNAPGIASISNIPSGKYKSIKFVLDANHGNVWINEESFGFHLTNSTQIEMEGNFEVITGITTNIKLNFDLSLLQYNYSVNSFTLPSQIVTITKTSFELPFTPGILILKLTKSIENIDSKKVGIQEIDAILEKYSLLSILPFVADDTNVDKETAKLIGLDRTYFLLFEAKVDLLQVNFALTNKPGIEWVITNTKTETSAVPDDPEANTGCFFCTKYQIAYLTAINAYNGWNISTGSPAVKIAVIDSGIDDTHPDLVGKIIQNRSFEPATCYHWGIFPYECVTHSAMSRPLFNGKFGWNHGTHVAGTIGASTNNGIGIAGITWSNPIIAINVFYPGIMNDPISSDRLIAYGILDAINAGAKVINMSLGAEGYEYCQWGCLVRIHTSALTRDAVRYGEAKRVVMVASSGNKGRRISPFPGTSQERGSFPASFNEVISVGNLDASNSYSFRYPDSNYGKVDIVAPGSFILSTSTNNQYIFMTGTSMAAPMVSGLAALILSVDPNYHPKDVLKAMCNQATPLTQTGNPMIDREYFGCGRINIGATLAALVPAPLRPNIVSYCGAVDQVACPAGRWFLPWEFQFVATGGTPPFQWTYEDGGLPTNSWLDPNTGRLVGGATWWFGPGWTFMLRVTDSAGQSDIRSFYFASGL
ncbi:hypothetical protein CH354_00010 [Leptospira levettii]|uniref:S8 family serine peptidase n=1 Tax=Leptospira levettii TaxID=2023178 RepID=UPI000C2ACA6D|nr:S8 family serine peptidase [Leptospira levettii]PJZ37694.1 hypothetical protein CH354_00010 [Leptospira levettii]PKA01553.1 hypothetical protein CH369_07315 [Leptospira levettii]